MLCCVSHEGDCFTLCTEASGRRVGDVLYIHVDRNDERLPVAYYNKQLSGTESKYSATEIEALAKVRAVENFAHWLWGKRFTMSSKSLII